MKSVLQQQIKRCIFTLFTELPQTAKFQHKKRNLAISPKQHQPIYKVTPGKEKILKILLEVIIIMNRYSSGGSQEENKYNQTETKPTPSKKITISYPASQLKSYDQEQSTKPVTIYLHAPSKKSVKIEIQAKISMTEIKKIAEEKIGLQKDRQLLYLNGKNVTEYGFVLLQNNTIIHVLSSDDLCGRNEQLKVKLTILNTLSDPSEKKEQIVKYYKISAGQTVAEFGDKIQESIRSELQITNSSAQFYFLQSSRLLEKSKTFVEQDVTKSSDIICVITEHQLKTRFSNDTKEEILHDISELLGFGETPQNLQKVTREVKFQKKSIKPRYLPPVAPPKRKIQRSYPPNEYRKDEDPYGLMAAKALNNSVTLPNFKKKSNPLAKTYSFDDTPNRELATKIKSSKSKKDLQELLNSQQKQKMVFQSPEIIKQALKEEKEDKEEDEEKIETKEEVKESALDLQRKRPSPQIPKSMPIKERRQIRLQIQKLFDLGNDKNESQSQPSEASDCKQEKKPISPPTESSKKQQKPQRQKNPLRMAFTSRPQFLDKLRIPLKDQK